jgi:hypothetical protein
MTACLAAGGRYGTYGQLVGDLRRMFTNALAYNKKHLETDSTGLSKGVYEAAIFLQEKLERLITLFTIDVADKIQRGQLINEEKNKKESAVRQRQDEIAEELRVYRAEELARLKREDEHFARYIYLCVFIHMCIYIYIYLYMFVIYIYIYIYIYI